MTELIDLVDEKDNKIGKSTVEEVHSKNLLHRAVHIFIVNSEDKLFCRKRSSNKKIYPLFWSTSVGAHVLSGQKYDSVAADSLQKHLGLKCELINIGKVRVQDESENEISATYVGYSDDEMKINKDEIEGGVFLTAREIQKLIKTEKVTPHTMHSLDLYLDYVKQKYAIIIHGTQGHPQENWFPWLKQELKKYHYEAIVPQFPTPENQNPKEWFKVFKNYEKYLNQSTILIGHSCGC